LQSSGGFEDVMIDAARRQGIENMKEADTPHHDFRGARSASQLVAQHARTHEGVFQVHSASLRMSTRSAGLTGRASSKPVPRLMFNGLA
jgi:hypothetical protein